MTKENTDEILNKDSCIHNLSLKHRSGLTIVNVKPLFSYDSQNIIIACGSNIKVFSIKSGECVQIMKYHSTPVIGLQENKKNMLQIYSCSEDGVVIRWDYSGRILQVYKMKMPIICFYAPLPDEKWFVTRKYEDNYRLYSITPKRRGYKDLQLIQKPVVPKENAIDFSTIHKFMACVYENKLTIYLFESKKIIGHLTGERKLTCVVCHPFNPVVATGDDQGRVIVWSNALYNNHPIKSIYHWHTLPVADLAFSPEGSHIHSGGGESALIKWNLFSEERNILPRLGAPIERIIASKDNNFLITTHSDNVLQVINAQRTIVQVIQGLTRSQKMYGKVLPVGLLYNAHLKALVMNGKPGHLQFFDLKQDKLMFNLDIASKNFMSQNREIAVYNIDVQKAAMDETGLWLATTEYWCNNDASPHIWLKFWQYDLEKQMFTLNTNVYMPHNKDLNCVAFKPNDKHSENSPLVVTTSNDGCFKIWTLNSIPNESKLSWGCEFVGHYRNMTPGSAAFSEDGSVLAVAFGSAATLWRVSNLALKGVLFNKKNKRDIKQLLFGRHAGFKYLICHDCFTITVWDCSSLSKNWMVYYEIQTLVSDPYSDNIAAFCKEQNLKIFKPNSPQPLDYIVKVSPSPIVSAVFVPSSSSNGISGCFKEKSQLYFIDEAQNLLTVSETDEDEEGMSTDKKTVAQNIIETPFRLLQAAQAVSDVKPVKVEQFNVVSKKEDTIISNPTWQDPEVLLKATLPKLLIQEKEETSEERASQKEMTMNGKDKEGIQIKFQEDWMSRTLNSMEVKPVDFSFLQENVRFVS